MKKTSNLLLAFFAVLILLLVGQYFWDACNKKVPEGMVLVEQATVDSLRAYVKIADSLEVLANLPPDTVIDWHIIYIDTSKFAETVPLIESDSVDSTLLTVTDSLVIEGEISAWIEFQLRGQLETGIKWEYKPIIKEKQVTIKIPAPYPVIETLEVPKLVTGHYLSFAADGNNKLLIFGLDYDVVRKDHIYGLQYRKWGNDNMYGVKIGITLNNIFKRIKNGT